MKQKRCFLQLAGAAAGIWGLTALMPADAQTHFPSDVNKTQCNLNSNEFQSWITLPLFGLNSPVYDRTSGMPYVFPVNGPDFNDTTADHCDFYKWGAQMFLWTTSTIGDIGKKPATPHYPATLPLVFNTEFFYRLSSDHKKLLAQGENVNSDNLAISLRTAKNDEDQSIGQAGGNGVLLTQPPTEANKKSSLTYYGTHTNRQYGYFQSMYKTMLTNGSKPAPQQQFPTTAAETCAALKYAEKHNYVEKGAIPGAIEQTLCPKNGTKTGLATTEKPTKTSQTSSIIPKIEPAVDFLSMTVEAKTSWVEATSLPASSKGKYILQNLQIPIYDRTKADQWTVKGSATREMALVGMHVVGTAKGHPEMIWATIEHENNAPNALYYYMNNEKKIIKVSPPKTKSGWLYSDGKTVDKITEYAKGCDDSPMPAGCVHKSDIVSADGKDHIAASNVNRLNPWGIKQMKNDPNAISQTTQIIALNRDVKANLKAQNAKDPRQYYFLSGAVWTSDGSIPEHGTAKAITGSPMLANTSMETFEQTSGCFGCHNTFGSSNGLEISHIFDGISSDLPTVPGK